MTARGPAARFDRVQVEMLECVYQHRLLSTGQLHVLYRDGLALRRTQRALAAMERVGWLASVRQPGGMKLWFVTAAGADAVEAIPNRAEQRRKVIPREQAAGPLQQHTLAVNEVGVAFVRAARECGDEFGPLAWRNEIAHSIGAPHGRRVPDMLIADAVLSYVRDAPDGRSEFHYRFVELDRATMPVDALAAKLGRYVRLFDFQAPGASSGAALWSRYYPVFPNVMVVLANGLGERLERRRRLLLALLEADHRDLPFDVFVCQLEDLIEHGPFAEVFDRSGAANGLVDWIGRAGGEPEDEPAQEESEAGESPTAPVVAEGPAPVVDPWGRW